MKWIAFFLLGSSWVFAGPLEDLASPSQKVRDKAAEELRKTFVLPPRKAWEELAASIKPGDTKVSVVERMKAINAKGNAGSGSGQSSSESYRLDGAWVLQVVFVRLDATKTSDEAMTVMKASLQEHLQHVWVKPPEGFTGTWTTYFVNGQRSHEFGYESGRYSGDFTSFHSNGSKAVVQHYGPNGVEGDETGYFPSGAIAYRGSHKDGKQMGTWTHYNEDGSVRSTKEFPEQGK